MAQKNTRTTGTQRQTTRTAPKAAATRIDEGNELLGFIPEKFRSLAWCVLLLLSLLIFFGGPILNNEYFNAQDNISWESYRPYLEMMDEKGESPQWMPYIFSGMPGVAAYMVTGSRSWDLSMTALHVVQDIFSVINPEVMRVLFYYFLLGLGVFFLMRWRGIRRSISFFSAFAVMFSTWIIVWIMIGHNTKPMVLAFLPWTILFLGQLIERWSLLRAALLILAVHFLFESAHPQTAFYGALLVAIWMITELVASLVGKDRERLRGVVRASLVGVAAACLTVAMGWDRMSVATSDYNDYSTRGADPLLTQYATTQDPYDYATGWSFDLDETFTYIVPTYFGFGKMELDAIPQAEGQALPTYWGNAKMPFTDAGHYMGIIVLILSIYGVVRYRRSPFVLGLAIAGFVGWLLSLGGNVPILYDIFYNIVPKFSQFRAPSQSLVILEFVGPILAGFGLSALLSYAKERVGESTANYFKYGAIAAGAFMLIVFIMKSMYVGAMSADPGIARAFQDSATVVAEAMYGVMRTDWIISSLLAAAFCLLAWAFLKGKIKGSILIASVIALTILDLWRVDAKAMHENVPHEQAFSVFAETDADLFLKKDTSVYRIANVATGHPNYPARHLHQHIGGYSAAKMRRYQDLMDATAQGSTSYPGPGVAWDILNTKYLVAPQPMEENNREVLKSAGGNVYLRTSAMPRAWFVDRVEVLEDSVVLDRIKTNAFDPRTVAYVPEKLETTIEPIRDREPVKSGDSVTPVTPRSGDSLAPADSTIDTTAPPRAAGDEPYDDKRVRVTKWEPHHIEIAADATGSNFLVVSEMFYPVAWHAFIDGKPVETIRANYLLRGIIVPPGEHTITFEYKSENHETGKTISLIVNLIVLALLAAGIFLEMKRRKREQEVAADRKDDDVVVDDTPPV